MTDTTTTTPAADIADRLTDAAEELHVGGGLAAVVLMDRPESVRFAGLHYAASRDQARPVLTGVSLDWADGDGTVRAVVTDSYRLAVRTYRPVGDDDTVPERHRSRAAAVVVDYDDAGDGFPNTECRRLYDARALCDAVKTAAKTDWVKRDVGRVGVFVPADDRAAVVVAVVLPDGTPAANGHRAMVPRIDGAFPDWRRLIPGDGAAGFGDLESADAFAFNARYLADVARVMGTADAKQYPVRFTSASPRKPAILEVPSSDPTRSELTYLLMPIRI